jgi:hypothetical protein
MILNYFSFIRYYGLGQANLDARLNDHCTLEIDLLSGLLQICVGVVTENIILFITFIVYIKYL